MYQYIEAIKDQMTLLESSDYRIFFGKIKVPRFIRMKMKERIRIKCIKELKKHFDQNPRLDFDYMADFIKFADRYIGEKFMKQYNLIYEKIYYMQINEDLRSLQLKFIYNEKTYTIDYKDRVIQVDIHDESLYGSINRDYIGRMSLEVNNVIYDTIFKFVCYFLTLSQLEM